MSERRKVLLEGDTDEVIAGMARIIGEAGYATFEVGYEVDGDPDREPEPGEEITWYAEVGYPAGAGKERHELRSSDDHGKAMVLVVSDLLVKLGANVAVLDNRQ